MCCASTFSIKADLTALIYGLGSNLAADRGVNGQCREIHTNQPDDYKAKRVEVNHKVIPCTISLQCQKRGWHVIAHIMVIKSKFLSTFVCAYCVLCLLCVTLFCGFSRVKDFILCIGSGFWVDKVLFCPMLHNTFGYS